MECRAIEFIGQPALRGHYWNWIWNAYIRPLRFPCEKCQKCQRADFRGNKSECKANGYRD